VTRLSIAIQMAWVMLLTILIVHSRHYAGPLAAAQRLQLRPDSYPRSCDGQSWGLKSKAAAKVGRAVDRRAAKAGRVVVEAVKVLVAIRKGGQGGDRQ
jgi:hypothetical protein